VHRFAGLGALVAPLALAVVVLAALYAERIADVVLGLMGEVLR
jgi:hypothetical protein